MWQTHSIFEPFTPMNHYLMLRQKAALIPSQDLEFVWAEWLVRKKKLRRARKPSLIGAGMETLTSSRKCWVTSVSQILTHLMKMLVWSWCIWVTLVYSQTNWVLLCCIRACRSCTGVATEVTRRSFDCFLKGAPMLTFWFDQLFLLIVNNVKFGSCYHCETTMEMFYLMCSKDILDFTFIFTISW